VPLRLSSCLAVDLFRFQSLGCVVGAKQGAERLALLGDDIVQHLAHQQALHDFRSPLPNLLFLVGTGRSEPGLNPGDLVAEIGDVIGSRFFGEGR